MQWKQVCALALKLPGVEESSSHGRPALKVQGKGICYLNNPEDIVFHLENVDEQQFLLETQPEVYYITPHYVGWASIRARLKAITAPEVSLRLKRAWFVRAPARFKKLHGADPALAIVRAAPEEAPKKPKPAAPGKKAAAKTFSPARPRRTRRAPARD